MKRIIVALGLALSAMTTPLSSSEIIQAYVDAAHAIRQTGNSSGALKAFLEALAINPDIIDAQFGVPLKPWTEQDIATINGHALPIDKILRAGDDANGKTILVYYKKGHGDTLMFSRFLTPLIEQYRPAKVLFMPQKGLKSLFVDSTPLLGNDIEVIDAETELNTLTYDFHAHLLSLPYLVDTAVNSLPHRDPYLIASSDKLDHPLIDKNTKKVGIIWQGDPSHVHDKDRSVPLSTFQPLTNLPGYTFYSLQVGYGREQLQNVHNITDLGQYCTTFADVASWMACMDTVITIDSAGAHLASGLGIPTFILIPHNPDLRWVGEGSKSFWSNTASLMRQSEAGGWPEVVDRIKTVLTTTP